MIRRRLAFVMSVLMILSLTVGCKAKSSDQQTSDSTQGKNTETVSTEELPESTPTQEVSIPCLLEDGRLKINSLFQFTGMNPDFDNRMEENIAALELTNTSDKHLTEAELSVTLSDGTAFRFNVTDVPAGKTVWAFDTANSVYAGETTTPDAVTVICNAKFEDAAPTLAGVLTVDEQDAVVSLTNTGATDLTNLTVYCHCFFFEAYFGGITYAYPVDNIPAGETVTVQAVDCFLGKAEVVRITQNG